jgi:ParB family chromosome partitioning protein
MNAEITLLPVDQIVPLIRRAREAGAFKRMKESIREEGLLQPIQVRKLAKPDGQHKYELICGQGRLEAFKALRRPEIPAIILDVSEPEIIGRFLSENVLRKDLPWLDQAKLIRDELRAGDKIDKVAARLFITEGHASKLVRILKQMSPKVEREFKHLTVAEAESLVSLPATGQEIVIETLTEIRDKKGQRNLEYVVKKAKEVAEEGAPLTKTALKQSLRRVTEELDKLRQVLKLKRLHASLGPENLKLLVSDKAFRKAMDRSGINYDKFLEASK